MNKYFCHILTVITLLICNSVFAQSNSSLDKTLDILQKQAAEYPFEKVHLHLDRPYYSAGDTIWFKGYTVIDASHRLSGYSAVLNVELIDEHNYIQKSLKLPLISGITYGDIDLADTLQAGNYRIRAYTNWMRNAGAEYFFDKTITIVNAISSVFTKSNYTYALNKNHQTVNANINYTDINGKPYANKEVSYTVKLDPQLIAKGKGITDESGKLHITFTNPTPGTLSSGQILTTIKLNNQQIVNNSIAIKATTDKVDVQFFPESGNLVNGIRSKVAFKAVGADGLGAEIKGTITDDGGNELAVFNSTHLGMGTFMLAPEAGKTYKANITYADSTKATIDLPKALDKGYVLTINNRDTANIVVKITGTGYENQTGGLTLVAQSGGVVYLQAKGSPGKSSFIANIAKNKLPSGIMQFTLFSDSGEPLNERLVFIQNPDLLKLSLNAAKPSYAPREKVRINLFAKDKEAHPVQGNFSVAVTNESMVPVDENTENTILSDILLTSDIRGYVEQPNYYFANVNEKTIADLDVLMLTQGYHRFEWKKVMSNIQPNILYQPEKAINVAGMVKDMDGKPVDKAKVMLLSNSGDAFVMDTLSDKNGRFVFSFDFKDSSKFILKASKKGSANLLVEPDKEPSVINNNKNAADIHVSINDGLEVFLQNSKEHYDEDIKNHIGNHSVALKEVNINTTRAKTAKELTIAKAVESSSNLNGKGVADQIFTYADFEGRGCATLADCLEGKLLGHITFTKRGNPDMAVYIDGILSKPDGIDMDNIASIEVLRSGGLTAIYGTQAGYKGVMVITMKHGQQFTDAKTGAPVISPRGYYKSKQFYSPKYDSPNSNSKIVDLRTTIYWKPIIETDKEGNAFFEYYNADSKGRYRVTVEGIDYNGSLGRQVYHYNVQ